MARRRRNPEPSACPFIDLDDPRCARHFSLGRMHEAFDLCLGQQHRCATFYRLQAEQRATIRLTLFGQPYPRKTGTTGLVAESDTAATEHAAVPTSGGVQSGGATSGGATCGAPTSGGGGGGLRRTGS